MSLMDETSTHQALRARIARLCEHAVAPPALEEFGGLRELRAQLEALAAAPTSGAPEAAMLANAFVREGRYLEAIAAYERAVALEPRFAAAHLAIGELASMLHDDERSRCARETALDLERCYLDPWPVGERPAVVLLLRDAPYSVNTPLELLLDRSRVALHKCYIEGDVQLPPYDVAISAFGYAHHARGAVERASRVVALAPERAINDPRRFETTAREALARTLADIDGVLPCDTNIVQREGIEAIAYPSLVRPRDTHAGRGLALANSVDEVRAHVARFPCAAYHVTPFIDYRSSDGYYRKMRAIVVDGEAYPYHLAISSRWMVHYQGSPMREHAWMREEEARFLRDPAVLVPGWSERLHAIAQAIGLDYVGIDLGVLPDGRIVVFEADPAMLVHDEDPTGILGYKSSYFARIREAFHALIARRVERSQATA